MIITDRILIQDNHRLGLQMDDPLPAELNGRFRVWMNSLVGTNELRIPRCSSPTSSPNPELLTYCDASSTASGVAYLRQEQMYCAELRREQMYMCGLWHQRRK